MAVTVPGADGATHLNRADLRELEAVIREDIEIAVAKIIRGESEATEPMADPSPSLGTWRFETMADGALVRVRHG